MVRNYMGISKDAATSSSHSPGQHSEMIGSAEPPTSGSSMAVAPSATFEVLVSKGQVEVDGSTDGRRSEPAPAVSPEQRVKLEAHVGYQAGILSSAFSISQVKIPLVHCQPSSAVTHGHEVPNSAADQCHEHNTFVGLDGHGVGRPGRLSRHQPSNADFTGVRCHRESGTGVRALVLVGGRCPLRGRACEQHHWRKQDQHRSELPLGTSGIQSRSYHCSVDVRQEPHQFPSQPPAYVPTAPQAGGLAGPDSSGAAPVLAQCSHQRHASCCGVICQGPAPHDPLATLSTHHR